MEFGGVTDFDAEAIHDPRTGERVANAMIDRENDEIDRRYGLIPRGKSLSGGNTLSPVLRLVVSSDAKDKIIEAAAAEGMSVSRWLRRTVEARLAA